jgi:DNA/RNA-binding domain of Phe-tRNA-synthetase-like protein
MVNLNIDIAPQLKATLPQLCLGVIQCSVEVNVDVSAYQALTAKIDALAEGIAATTKTEDIAVLSEVTAARNAYKTLGKSPSKYRCSSEALLRRITQGNRLYQVNNVVDVNNLVSLIGKHPVGSYDVDQLSGDITFRIGSKGESYIGIGKGSVNLENMPVFADQQGAFGCPTSDSNRAMITPKSRHIMMVIIAFSGKSELVELCKSAAAALKQYCLASEIEYKIVEGN